MRAWWAGLACVAFGLFGCIGPAGDAGLPGPQGVSGTDGQTGKDGTDGTDGSTGATGAPGKNAILTGPGLKLEILATELSSGTAKVTFRLSDDAGTALDREGKYTEGVVTVRMNLAWLGVKANGDAGTYTSYTTQTQKSPITGESAIQGAADEGGTFAEVDFEKGIYSYQFGTPIDVANPTRTHTLGVWATRPFQGSTYTAEAVHHFLPAGGEVNSKRDIVRTAACNTCHGELKAHEGARRDVELCITCHSPQTVDPDTGNTVDFPVMVHKIHRGKSLAGPKNGAPYQIIGYMQSVHDYSTVGYPQELQHCDTCHTGDQGKIWEENPTRKSCGACHDGTSFEETVPAGMVAHPGGPLPDDSKCNVCHPPAGGLAGISTKHLTPLTDPASPVIKLSIVKVENTAAGQTPEVVFDVQQNGQPLDILATPMARLLVTVAGPTTDYATFWQNTAQGSGATGTLTAEGASYRYKMSTPIPAGATGSYAVAMEGYIQPGGAAGPRFSAKNPVTYVAVTDAAPVPRRTVVDTALCNNCHRDLQAHGGSRNQTEYCVLCHNPPQVNDERVARFEGATITAQSLDMGHFIHRLHTGDELAQQPYILGGFPAPTKANPAGTPIDFGEVRYPNDRKKCWNCHKGDSYKLPLADGTMPAKTQTFQCTEDPMADADSYCDQRVLLKETLIYPESAACTGCHDAKAVVAHAETATTQSGAEACATCHGSGRDYDVQKVHQPSL